jgi:hypothetical protein
MFNVLRVVSVGLFFTRKLYLTAWRGGTFSSMDKTSTVVRKKTQQKMSSEFIAPLSHFYIVLLLLGDGTPKPPRSRLNTAKHNTAQSIQKHRLIQHIIETSNMETLTAERHPEGLFAPLLRRDWETALTVILHSLYYTKRVDPLQGLPLHVAIEWGAPVAVVTALLETYPDATTIRNYSDDLPCHVACLHGISSEGMKMLLRGNPDAAGVINRRGETPMQCLNHCGCIFFLDEKEQVRNDLKQHSSYWKSKEQQALLQRALEETDRRRSMRRSVARIILGRHLDNYDLVALIIEYL